MKLRFKFVPILRLNRQKYKKRKKTLLFENRYSTRFGIFQILDPRNFEMHFVDPYVRFCASCALMLLYSTTSCMCAHEHDRRVGAMYRTELQHTVLYLAEHVFTQFYWPMFPNIELKFPPSPSSLRRWRTRTEVQYSVLYSTSRKRNLTHSMLSSIVEFHGIN